jgi:hypothetical protein
MVFSFSQARAEARSCLVQGLTCDSHGSDESLLLSVRGSDGGLSRGYDIVLLPLGGGDGGLLPVDGGEVRVTALHSRQDGGSQGWWWATVSPRVRSEMSEN